MMKLNDTYNHEMLIEVQNRLKDILSGLNNICIANNIEYYLYAGTLLGAIRHEDIIPWDDDIDVVMKREQFNLFTKAIEGNKDYKIVYNGLWVPRLIPINNNEEGYFIDIFIYDGKPSDKKKFKKQVFKLQLFQGMIKRRISFKNKSFINNLKQIVTWTMGLFLTHNYKLKKYIKISSKFNDNNNQEYFVSNDEFGTLSKTYNKELLDSTIITNFGTLKMQAPVGYEVILTKLYGNYMELPPIEKRVPEHLNIFKKN